MKLFDCPHCGHRLYFENAQCLNCGSLVLYYPEHARFALSGVDPVKVTEYSIVLSAAALPLTYFPILVIANDPAYVGEEHTNGRMLNAIATVYLVILLLVSLAVLPLIVITRGGA